ncbi:hypothetical protein [Pseudoalteromonas sp. S16_S37]|uniref:hypothetical protein n=1 Tax=Pseudoalteromonas sp. S16_S37 TaxID=2720228 RepID=UPI001680276F|nr:hypothetical protein [Pseudoalteromonas sp. S16_S37]MBD1583480.1 hypothetical protein [Pseudoalteromonas sp. S16_S37]
MENLKQVRAQLKLWGRYWASKEALQGYAQKSSTHKIYENHVLGGSFSSDAHLYSHGSNGINPPEHIALLSDKIETLRAECKKVLIAKYVKKMDLKEACAWGGFDSATSVDFWLLRAETGLLSRQ